MPGDPRRPVGRRRSRTAVWSWELTHRIGPNLWVIPLLMEDALASAAEDARPEHRAPLARDADLVPASSGAGPGGGGDAEDIVERHRRTIATIDARTELQL